MTMMKLGTTAEMLEETKTNRKKNCIKCGTEFLTEEIYVKVCEECVAARTVVADSVVLAHPCIPNGVMLQDEGLYDTQFSVLSKYAKHKKRAKRADHLQLMRQLNKVDTLGL